MASKQTLSRAEQYNDSYNKDNLICPRCISNSLKIWVKTKKGNKEFEKLNLLSKEISWIIDKNKFLEKSGSNRNCSICENNSVYLHNKYFVEAISEIIKMNEIPENFSNEFKSYFKKIS
ncbi:MAG: hypothetical protein AABX03_04370 [Nanoarchaeota archaeon]